MLAETLGLCVVAKIVQKIQIRDILLQISSVGQIEHIGVLLAISLDIGFCKLALANACNTGQEYLALSLQSFMKYGQFLIPPAEKPTGARNIRIGYYIRRHR